MPQGLAARMRIVLLANEGVNNNEIAQRLGLSQATVGKWRRRFVARGVEGLHDDLRPGRPRSISDERVAELLRKTLQDKPSAQTHWSCRDMAAETGISKSHSSSDLECFLGSGLTAFAPSKLSNDPFFVEKVRDIVGLYLDPPTDALVLCVDEKSQCQALERTQPALPMGLGYLQGGLHPRLPPPWNHHPVCGSRRGQRQGDGPMQETASAPGVPSVPAAHRRQRPQPSRCSSRGRQLRLSQTPESSPLAGPQPSASTSTSPQPIPAGSTRSRLGFGIITNKAIRRGSFSSVKQLVERIDHFVQSHNQGSHPFAWTATADAILEELGRTL